MTFCTAYQNSSTVFMKHNLRSILDLNFCYKDDTASLLVGEHFLNLNQASWYIDYVRYTWSFFFINALCQNKLRGNIRMRLQTFYIWVRKGLINEWKQRKLYYVKEFPDNGTVYLKKSVAQLSLKLKYNVNAVHSSFMQ